MRTIARRHMLFIAALLTATVTRIAASQSAGVFDAHGEGVSILQR